MRAFTAVVNPTAGGADAAARLLPVTRLLREGGAEVRVEYSRGLEHACDLAREAAARDEIVVGVGGDGMVGALAGALAGTDGVLAILPAGRGNDFARHLGLPSEPEPVAALLRDGEPTAVDLIDANGTIVAGSVYMGVDAVANVYINRAKRLPGSVAYYLGPLRAISTWKAAAYRLTIDGEPREEVGYTVVAANSSFYGYGRQVAPGARVDDGQLDIVVIRDAPKRLFFAVMRELADGSHVHRPEVEILRGRELRVEADRTLPFGGDGELLGELPVTVKLRPGGLRVLMPPPGAEPGPDAPSGIAGGAGEG
jgi:diacylglycerol kinase (ATP)